MVGHRRRGRRAGLPSRLLSYRGPERKRAFLDEQVRSTATVAAQRVKKLIADLGSEKFALRDHATIELRKLGEIAWPALRLALSTLPALEERRRIENLLASAGLIQSPDALRTFRAVEALEYCGTAEARKLLQGLVKDLPDTWAAHLAKPALERLDKRP